MVRLINIAYNNVYSNLKGFVEAHPLEGALPQTQKSTNDLGML
jgi:hypothetical protein